MGDLVRVKEAVSCDEEMSAIGYLVAKQKPSPAILFDNIKGYEKSPYKAQSLWNILGPSIPRIALTMEEPHDTPTVELIRRVKDKLKNRMAPREVPPRKRRFYQNTLTGDQIDLTQLADSRATGRWTAAVTPAPRTALSPAIPTPAISTSAPIA